jgi:SAM-dependent methyltransferase
MAPVPFVCPDCKAALKSAEAAYRCAHCDRCYPILFGIPDFRLRSDRYLTLEEERAKAGRLHDYGLKASFEDLVAYYYSITDDVPDDLAVRYRAYVRAAPERGARIVSEFGPVAPSGSLIDLGCGTGGLLVAAAPRFGTVAGVDIALRWLVMCKKRLDELGVEARLVCADAEALPFPQESFTHAVAADLLENVYDPGNTIAEIARHLKPGGVFWLSAANKYCLGPHPLVRIWAIGYVPEPLRGWVVEKIKGLNLLRHVNLVSPLPLAGRCRARGLEVTRLEPLHVGTGSLDSYPAVDRALISLYRAALGLRILRYALVLVGPAFEMLCRRTGRGEPPGQASGDPERSTRCG